MRRREKEGIFRKKSPGPLKRSIDDRVSQSTSLCSTGVTGLPEWGVPSDEPSQISHHLPSNQHLMPRDNNSDTTDVDLNSELGEDGLDGRPSSSTDPSRHRTAVDHYTVKLKKTKRLIQRANEVKQENVKEYLSLSDKQTQRGGDRSQTQRLKSTFERKNKDATDEIERLQRKYDAYRHKLSDLERGGGCGPAGPTSGAAGGGGAGTAGGARLSKGFKDMSQGLKEFGANLKEGVTGLGSLATKPTREFASKMKSRFGSADNLSNGAQREGSLSGACPLSSVSANGDKDSGGLRVGIREVPDSADSLTLDQASPNSVTLPPNFKLTIPSEENGSIQGLEESAADTTMCRECGGRSASRAPALVESDLAQSATIQELQRDVERSGQELELLKMRYEEHLGELEQDMEGVRAMVTEHAYRCTRLEEGLNDLGELYQNRLSNMERDLGSGEEKMEYQLEERTHELREAMETVMTRVAKLEMASQQQQQLMQVMEGMDNDAARQLLTKLINFFLTILAVLLVCISTVTRIVTPFVTNRWIAMCAIVFLVVAFLTAQNREMIVAFLHQLRK